MCAKKFFVNLFGLVLGILLASASNSILANIEIGDDIQLGDSLDTLQSKLDNYCDSLHVISVIQPQFPLAETSEDHLICNFYTKGNVTFGKAAFTVADNQLVHMEAVEVDVDATRSQLGRSFGEVSGIEIYGLGTHWLNVAQESLIWVNAEGRHLNLFASHNHFLDDEEFSYGVADISIPSIVKFSRSLSDHRTQLEEVCAPARIEPEDEIWLPNAPAVQIQANCYNYQFAGFERKLELVYGDDKLEVVWILTAKPEEQRIRKLLVELWGPPEIDNDVWTVFNEGKIALRKDVPEILLLSDEILPYFEEYFSNSTEL